MSTIHPTMSHSSEITRECAVTQEIERAVQIRVVWRTSCENAISRKKRWSTTGRIEMPVIANTTLVRSSTNSSASALRTSKLRRVRTRWLYSVITSGPMVHTISELSWRLRNTWCLDEQRAATGFTPPPITTEGVKYRAKLHAMRVRAVFSLQSGCLDRHDVIRSTGPTRYQWALLESGPAPAFLHNCVHSPCSSLRCRVDKIASTYHLNERSNVSR